MHSKRFIRAVIALVVGFALLWFVEHMKAAEPRARSRSSALPLSSIRRVPPGRYGRQTGRVPVGLAGKQDLFVVQSRSSRPSALTDFPVNSDMLQSDIGQFEWVSADQLVFAPEVNSGRLTVSALRRRGWRDSASMDR